MKTLQICAILKRSTRYGGSSGVLSLYNVSPFRLYVCHCFGLLLFGRLLQNSLLVTPRMSIIKYTYITGTCDVYLWMVFAERLRSIHLFRCASGSHSVPRPFTANAHFLRILLLSAVQHPAKHPGFYSMQAGRLSVHTKYGGFDL